MELLFSIKIEQGFDDKRRHRAGHHRQNERHDH